MTAERIAVTGVGMVSALGSTAASSFESLCRGERGIGEITLFDTAGQRTNLAAEVKDFRVEDVTPASPPGKWSRSDALALVAARDALASAGVSPAADPLGIAVGVTTAGMLEAESFLMRLGTAPGQEARPLPNLTSYPLNSTADRLSEVFGGTGPVSTICSACSSGANAIVQGALWLRLGRARRVLVGGTDALCRLTLSGFNALGATDIAPCRPFDARRGGLTLGEGAAFLVLEPERVAVKRGARVLAWLSSWAVGAEAHHITQPEPSAHLPAALLARAMDRAGLRPADVDYVNAHGTGTTTNDVVETLAIRAAMGDRAATVLVSSSKGQIGHTLGAAGALEAAITVLAVDRQTAPPTAGLETPDPACELNHVRGQGRAAEIRAAVSSSFGFGGTGAVLLFERANAASRPTATDAPRPVVVTGVATLGQGAPSPKLEPARSRRFDMTTEMVTSGAEAALSAAGRDAASAGLVSATAFGNVTRTAAFLKVLGERGPKRVPPAEFPHLLPSAPSGNASIYLGLPGPVLTTSALEVGGEAAFSLACDWIESGMADAMVAAAAEAPDDAADQVFSPACEMKPRAPGAAGGGFLVLETAAAAKQRGRKPLAAVRSRAAVPRSGLAKATLDGPRAPDRAVVVSHEPSEAVNELLSRTGWGRARRVSAVPGAGFHEALGAVALAEGASLVARGEADEVLVLGEAASRVYFVHLVRPS